jgi:hypothetical protein
MLHNHFHQFYKKFIVGTVLIMLLFAGWITYSFKTESDASLDAGYQRYFNSHYKVFSLNTPTNISFADEQVPLDVLDVRERLDRELLVNTYWQSQSLLFHKRANRWFPVIEPILAKHSVPDDFKYLAVIESGLMNVVSPAGATGYWQLLKETGKEYGLEINSEVDERYHVEKSTEAACRYLKAAYRQYGSWTMAAASYNMGMGGLQKQTNRQKVKNYYDLLLNEETSRYLFRILAAKEILTKPGMYGFHFRPKDLYPPYYTREVVVDTEIKDLAEWAISQGTNYKVLKILNPWLRDNYLSNPDKKKYRIKLPADNSFGNLPMELNPEQFAPADTLSTDTLK